MSTDSQKIIDVARNDINMLQIAEDALDGFRRNGALRAGTRTAFMTAIRALNTERRMLEQFVDREAGRVEHTIGGKPIDAATNPGAYGRTHDMDCPGCVGTPFTASPRSETYWAS